jgi:hypothetical protein
LFGSAIMFIVVQFPFTDVRGFLPLDSHRLKSPAWPNAEEGKEFIRGHGAVRKRRRGGIDQWAGERLYCTTTRALRFDRWPRTFRLQTGAWLPLDCAFRRFFTDGQAMARVEVGVRYRPDLTHPTLPDLARALTDEEWSTVCPEVLKLPVRVRTPGGALARAPLSSAGPLLAKHYLSATTAHPEGQPGVSKAWWYTSGAALALVEYRPGELRLPRYLRPVRSLEMAAIELSYQTAAKDKVGTWFLGFGRDANPDIVRRIRIHLFRLHAERECLKQVLRLISKGQLAVTDTPGPSALAEYLDYSATQLSREWREGLPQGDILKAAYEFDTIMAEGERADLLAAITTARRPLQRRLTQLTSAAVVINIGKNLGSIGGFTTVNDKSQTITNSTITNSTLVIGDAITKVTNSIQASSSSDAVKDALLTLTKAVEQMASSLPKQRQEEVARDLQALAAEATSPTPRRKWYEVSAEGLVDAAKAVAGIGAPVIESVKLLLGLLGGAAAV